MAATFKTFAEKVKDSIVQSGMQVGRRGGLTFMIDGVRHSFDPKWMIPYKNPAGVWHEPKLSRRKVNNFRNMVVRSGQPWPFDTPAKNPPVIFKGQKHDFDKMTKQQEIAQKMKEMPAKVEAYYQEMRARRARRYDPLYVLLNGTGGPKAQKKTKAAKAPTA